MPSPDSNDSVSPENTNHPEGGPGKKPTQESETQTLEAVQLIKKFKGRAVVKGVSLKISSGEIVGLLGPNGSGKTTSFYMVAGIIEPSRGKILMNGHDITKLSISVRSKFGIGYLPQESSVFKTMSVEDNIMTGIESNKGISAIRKKEILAELLEEFRISHIAKSVGSALSGGERRRVEVARCLAINPSFVLLDEPFAGIDPISISDIEAILEKLRDKNIGVLITDHNIRETLGMIDRGYILINGNIVTEGSKEEIVSNPLTREKYLGANFKV